MPNGYHNKILRVDLSTGEIGVEEPGEHFYRNYYGGWNFIAHYLLTETEPGIDPLGPDNILVFAPGILTGVPLGGGGRNAVGAKSPLTGGFGAGEVGGSWGAERWGVRTALRTIGASPDYRHNGYGFRCVLPATSNP